MGDSIDEMEKQNSALESADICLRKTLVAEQNSPFHCKPLP